jgi:hypothetical protein
MHLPEGDRMDVEKGGGVTLGIVPVKREAVILGDLPPQIVPAGREVGVLTHATRYEQQPDLMASSFPRQLYGEP